MQKLTSPLDHVRIAAPCSADWDQMFSFEDIGLYLLHPGRKPFPLLDGRSTIKMPELSIGTPMPIHIQAAPPPEPDRLRIEWEARSKAKRKD